MSETSVVERLARKWAKRDEGTWHRMTDQEEARWWAGVIADEMDALTGIERMMIQPDRAILWLRSLAATPTPEDE